MSKSFKFDPDYYDSTYQVRQMKREAKAVKRERHADEVEDRANG